MQPEDFLFGMGVTVKDVVTGIKGIVTGRTQWLTGCNTIGINTGVDKDGNPSDLFWVDETRCEVMDAKPVLLPGEKKSKTKSRDRGGPQEIPRRVRG